MFQAPCSSNRRSLQIPRTPKMADLNYMTMTLLFGVLAAGFLLIVADLVLSLRQPSGH